MPLQTLPSLHSLFTLVQCKAMQEVKPLLSTSKNTHYFLLHLFIIPIGACKHGGGIVYVNEYTYTHTNTPQIRKQNKKKPFKCKVLAGIILGSSINSQFIPGQCSSPWDSLFPDHTSLEIPLQQSLRNLQQTAELSCMEYLVLNYLHIFSMFHLEKSYFTSLSSSSF